MKRIIAFSIAISILLNFNSIAQKKDYGIYLQSGTINLPENVKNTVKGKQKLKESFYNDRYYMLLQFYKTPTDEEKTLLLHEGIELYEYIPRKAFLASLTYKALSGKVFQQYVRSVLVMTSDQKIEERLKKKPFPEWTVPKDGLLDVSLMYYRNIPIDKIKSELKSSGYQILSIAEHQGVLSLRIGEENLRQLASLPWVMWVEPLRPPLDIKNWRGKSLHRSNVIGSSNTGARNLTGKGVNVGIWDKDVAPHIDFHGRLHVIENERGDSPHGTHVAGTLAGAGILDPRAQGMAPEATLYTYNFQGESNNQSIIEEMFDAADKYGIVITQNSYGSKSVITGYNPYDLQMKGLDDIVWEYPYLVHVFSAGNQQEDRKDPFGTSSETSKNTISVGAVSDSATMTDFSSWGPTSDGRIKPDICSDGLNVYSTVFDNKYESEGWEGTSMACPGVSGTIAQIYQRYRQLKNNENPKASLIKALVCNTATDILNPGPDYKSGYGVIDGLKAVETLESKQFVVKTIKNGDIQNETIKVPAGTTKLKIMMAYSDRGGLPFATLSAVNILSLAVNDGSKDWLPWALDIKNPAKPAERKYEEFNNVKQITIDNPKTGDYKIIVEAVDVPKGPQEYSLVYVFEKPSLALTYPFGGELFNPGETEIIHWDASGTEGTFTLEYSTDLGSTWYPIASNIPENQRFYAWQVPYLASKLATVRIKQGSNSAQNDAVFTIMSVVSKFYNEPGFKTLTLKWNRAKFANEYDVFKIDTTGVKLMATVKDTVYQFTGLETDKDNYLTVQARRKSQLITGRRAPAVHMKSIPHYDIGVVAAIQPQTGFVIEPEANIIIKITSVGADILPKGFKIPLNYKIDENKPVKETFELISPMKYGDTILYAFSKAENFSKINSPYKIKIWTDTKTDTLYRGNDTIQYSFTYYTVIKQFPYTENFDTIEVYDYADNDKVIFYNYWNNDFEGNDIDWRPFIGKTHSGGTGPKSDHTTGFGKYLYTEASALNYKPKIIKVNTPYFDVSGLQHPLAVIWYNMFAQDSVMGSLHVDLYSNDNKEWMKDIVPPISGNQGQDWHQLKIDLQGFTGIIKIKIRAQTAGNFENDISIDDFVLMDQPAENLTALSLTGPNPGTKLSGSESLKLQMINDGTTTYNSGTFLNINYKINNSATVSENFSIDHDFVPGDTMQMPFATQADMSDLSKRFFVKAWIDNSNDQFKANDTVFVAFQRYCEPTSSYPKDGGIAQFQIRNTNNKTKKVNTSTGGYSFYGNQLIQLYRGSVTNFFLQSMDYGIYFKIWIDLNQDGEFNATNECFDNEGYGRIESIDDQFTIPLVAKLGLTRMRVRTSYLKEDLSRNSSCSHIRVGETEDYSVIIADRPNIDLELAKIITPIKINLEFTNTEEVSIKIANTGKEIINKGEKIDVGYKVNYNKPVNESFTLIKDLNLLDSVEYVFQSTADFYNGGEYKITFWLKYNADEDPVNDTLIYEVLNLKGTEWELQNSGFDPSTGIDYISIVDKNVVWATNKIGSTGDAGKLFTKTVDGGQNWTPGTISANRYLHASMIFAQDANRAWVPMYSTDKKTKGGLFYTTDGGKTWTRHDDVFNSLESFPDFVHFFNESEGLCVGDPINNNFEIYITSDGGKAWKKVSESVIPQPVDAEMGYVNTFSVSEDNFFYFGTDKGRIYYSADKGNLWSVLRTPIGKINVIVFKDKKYGIIGSYDDNDNLNYYYTETSGLKWNRLDFAGNLYPSALAYVPGTGSTFMSAGLIRSDMTTGISFSDDLGKKWNDYISQMFADQYLRVAFKNSTTGWVGSYNTPSAPAKGGIWKYIGPPLGANNFKSFKFADQLMDAKFDAENHTIFIAVSRQSNISKLIAEFKFTEGATVTINGKPQISGETENDFTNPVTYTIKAPDKTTTDWKVTVAQYTVGISEKKTNNQIFLSPNPSSGQIYLNNNQPAEIVVYNLLGISVYSKKTSIPNDYIDLSGKQEGIYLVRILTDNQYITKKVKIER